MPTNESQSHETDERLMVAVRDDNCKKSLEAIIERYFPMIHRTCYRLTLDWHHAEDLAQEIIGRIYLHRGKYQPNAKFKSYAMTITLNRCRDFLRSQKSRSENCSHELAPPIDVEPGRSLELTEAAESVRKVLSQLPDIYREVLVLRHYEDLQFQEIADLLGVPKGTIASRMAKALRLVESKIAHPVTEIK